MTGTGSFRYHVQGAGPDTGSGGTTQCANGEGRRGDQNRKPEVAGEGGAAIVWFDFKICPHQEIRHADLKHNEVWRSFYRWRTCGVVVENYADVKKDSALTMTSWCDQPTIN